MATTASGWPYAEPADHPHDWPAVSKALADKLEADVADVHGGSSSPQSDGEGRITVPHGMGRVPTAAFVQFEHGAGDNFHVVLQSFDATNIVARVWSGSGTNRANAACPVVWIAF